MDPTMQDPPEPEEGTEVSVVLIDALAEVAAHLKVMVPAQHDPASMYTFLSTRPDIYPCKPQLLEKVAEWISNPEAGERVNFYSAAEEGSVANGQGAGFMEPSAKQRAGPGIGSAKAAPQVTRVKRPTVASLATSVNELVLSSSSYQSAASSSSAEAGCDGGLFNPEQLLSVSRWVGAASTGLLDASAQISTMLQEMPPPRTAAPRMPQRPSSMPGGLQQQEVTELEAEKLEKPDHPSNDLAKAVLAQSNALTALVGQIASMGGDSLSDLTSSSSGLSSKGSVGRQKLQSELASAQRYLLRKCSSSHVEKNVSCPAGRCESLRALDERSYPNTLCRAVRGLWQVPRHRQHHVAGGRLAGALPERQHQCSEGQCSAVSSLPGTDCHGPGPYGDWSAFGFDGRSPKLSVQQPFFGPSFEGACFRATSRSKSGSQWLYPIFENWIWFHLGGPTTPQELHRRQRQLRRILRRESNQRKRLDLGERKSKKKEKEISEVRNSGPRWSSWSRCIHEFNLVPTTCCLVSSVDFGGKNNLFSLSGKDLPHPMLWHLPCFRGVPPAFHGLWTFPGWGPQAISQKIFDFSSKEAASCRHCGFEFSARWISRCWLASAWEATQCHSKDDTCSSLVAYCHVWFSCRCSFLGRKVWTWIICKTSWVGRTSPAHINFWVKTCMVPVLQILMKSGQLGRFQEEKRREQQMRRMVLPSIGHSMLSVWSLPVLATGLCVIICMMSFGFLLLNLLSFGMAMDFVVPLFLISTLRDKQEYLKLARLWSTKGLLDLFDEPPPENHPCRVFNCLKDERCDRQIGDRRSQNALERSVRGPSRFLPGRYLLTSLHCPPGSVLYGSITDRKDFYHQASVQPFQIAHKSAFFLLWAWAFPWWSCFGWVVAQDFLQEIQQNWSWWPLWERAEETTQR